MDIQDVALLRELHSWINNSGDSPEFPRFQSPPQGGVTAWYTMLLTALADDKERDFNLGYLRQFNDMRVEKNAAFRNGWKKYQ